MAKMKKPYHPPLTDTMLGHPVMYRSPRGGSVPLTAVECRQLLELYVDHKRSVKEIAQIFGIGVHTVYRILPLLGVRPQ
jgi:DNA-binding CsgD family transcriptional regulator